MNERIDMFLDEFFDGRHHVPPQVEIDYQDRREVAYPYRYGLATWDSCDLTKMVLLAHKYSVRVQVVPGPEWRDDPVVYILLSLREDLPGGDQWKTHPNLEHLKAIADIVAVNTYVSITRAYECVTRKA